MVFLSQFDAVSRGLVQRFFRKVMIFAAFAAFVAVLEPHGLVLMFSLLHTEFWFGGGMSIGAATFLRQRFAAPTLTYWDEAVAFIGIGTVSHMATALF